MIEYIIANATDLTALLLAVLGVASIVARLTPTEADNKVLEYVYKLVHALGLTKK